MGQYTSAINSVATSMGFGTYASGEVSTSMGNGTEASGFSATSMGASTIASGNYSTAMGQSNTASGLVSTATGRSTTASGNYSFSTGEQTFAKARGSFTTGIWNDNTDNPDVNLTAPTDRIFQIGNGSGSIRSNANCLRNEMLALARQTRYHFTFKSAANILLQVSETRMPLAGVVVRTADAGSTRNALEVYGGTSRFLA
jgi:hypothetical protein